MEELYPRLLAQDRVGVCLVSTTQLGPNLYETIQIDTKNQRAWSEPLYLGWTSTERRAWALHNSLLQSWRRNMRFARRENRQEERVFQRRPAQAKR